MDLKQHLLRRKRFFDEEVQQYKGPDPLKIRCDFFNWLENYSKEDSAEIYMPLLQETLEQFMDDPTYKQDLRFIRLWLNYSVTQPNPADVIKNMHNRGLGTECAILYSSWAEQLIKSGSFSNADSVFRMGLNGNIQSKSDLQKQYEDFLKDIGQKLLMGKILCPKCGSSYQSSGNSEPSDSVENWEWNPLKVGEVDDFKCPIAYFEDPDPSKIRMYPKDKVYPGNGQEFSLEEILAQEYERKYKEEEMKALAEAKAKEEEAKRMKEGALQREREAKKMVQSAVNEKPVVQASIPVVTPKMMNLPKRPRDSPGEVLQTKRAPGVVLETEWPQDIDNSLANSTTFTVHTKEAMNVVQDMWSSPAPSKFRPSHFQNPPPEVNQPPVTTPAPAPFEIFTEEEPAPPPMVQKPPFQVYDENVNAGQRKPSSRSAPKPRPMEIVDNENVPPDLIVSKPTFTPKAAIDIFTDSPQEKEAMEDVRPIERAPTKNRLQLFKDDGDDLAAKLESQARIQPPMFNVQDKNDDFSDITCNTKAFEFILPSSTPLAAQKIHKPLNVYQRTEESQKLPEQTNLSVILEQSKDKSGNSSTNSVASNVKSSKSGPLLQSDTISEDEVILEKDLLASVFRPSSIYQLAVLDTISEEDSINSINNSPHLFSDPSICSMESRSAKDRTKRISLNKTFLVSCANKPNESKALTPRKSSLRKPNLRLEPSLNSDLTVDKENLRPGMLGCPNTDLLARPNLSVPTRCSSRNKPLDSLHDKENVFYSNNLPETSNSNKHTVADYRNLSKDDPCIRGVPLKEVKTQVRKGSTKIPLRDSSILTNKIRSFSVGVIDVKPPSFSSQIRNSVSCVRDENILNLKSHVCDDASKDPSVEMPSSISDRSSKDTKELKITKSFSSKKAIYPLKSDSAVEKTEKNCKKLIKVNEVKEFLEGNIKKESLPVESKESEFNTKLKKTRRQTVPRVNTNIKSPTAVKKETLTQETSPSPVQIPAETQSDARTLRRSTRSKVTPKSYFDGSNTSLNVTISEKCSKRTKSKKDILENYISFSPQKLSKVSLRKSRSRTKKKQTSVPEVDGFDPFHADVIETLLEKVGFPKPHLLPIYHVKPTNLPTGTKTMKLGSETYSILGEIGKGAYAKVIKATNSVGNTMALKIEKPPCKWEFYIAKELQSRIHPTFAAAFMDITAAYIFNNGSVLETPYAKYGTLIMIINAHKQKLGKALDPGVILHFALELIDIVEHLHKCKIIHADLKPDNVVLRELPSRNEAQPCLQLIDFGRCIDMSLLPPDTKFHCVFKTEDNKCIEMKENKPWTYQIDLQGLASLLHTLIFSEYMKVQKKGDKWQLQKMIPRNFKRELWNPIFDSLLNVNPATDLPFNFNPMRESLAEAFESSYNTYLQHIKFFGNFISGK